MLPSTRDRSEARKTLVLPSLEEMIDAPHRPHPARPRTAAREQDSWLFAALELRAGRPGC
jgi:hypothetical protein